MFARARSTRLGRDCCSHLLRSRSVLLTHGGDPCRAARTGGSGPATASLPEADARLASIIRNRRARGAVLRRCVWTTRSSRSEDRGARSGPRDRESPRSPRPPRAPHALRSRRRCVRVDRGQGVLRGRRLCPGPVRESSGLPGPAPPGRPAAEPGSVPGAARALEARRGSTPIRRSSWSNTVRHAWTAREAPRRLRCFTAEGLGAR